MSFPTSISGMVAHSLKMYAWMILLAATAARAAEPIPLVRPEATYFAGGPDNLARVVDGVEAGPQGWSVAPKMSSRSRSWSGVRGRWKRRNSMSRCFSWRAARCTPLPSLPSPTPRTPSRRWVEIGSHLRSSDSVPRSPLYVARRTAACAPILLPLQVTGTIPDDVYRATVLLPDGRATGFRLEVFPVKRTPESPPGLSYQPDFDFFLTEFRVAVHTRETTNIALHRPVKASHTLFTLESGESQQAGALTDGLPATIAHPDDPASGRKISFRGGSGPGRRTRSHRPPEPRRL